MVKACPGDQAGGKQGTFTKQGAKVEYQMDLVSHAIAHDNCLGMYGGIKEVQSSPHPLGQLKI
jgi:hypothetical protein